MIIQIVFLLSAICAAYLVPFSARYANRREAMIARLSLRPLPILDCLLIALAAVLLLPVLSMIFEQGMRLFPGYPEYAQSAEAALRRGAAKYGVPALVGLLAALPAICEEFFFRGLLASILRELGLSRLLCILLGALVFAGMHFDLYRFLPMFAIGMITMWLVAQSESILAPIIYHLAHNACVLGLSLAQASYGALDTEVSANGNPVLPSIPLALILAALGICALLWFQARTVSGQSPNRKNLP